MLTQLVNRFTSLNKKEKVLMGIAICAVLIVVEIVRVYIIMPCLQFFVLEPIEYQGIEYYEDGTYLEFEKGDMFINSFHSYDFAKESEITEFYHIDNRLKDNLIEGKHHDIYIIDFDADINYEKIRDYITTEGEYNNTLNSIQIYMMPSEFGNGTDCFFFAFNDETQLMRYILVTEVKGINKDEMIRHIVQVFIRSSSYW